jgi:hypothetical protein
MSLNIPAYIVHDDYEVSDSLFLEREMHEAWSDDPIYPRDDMAYDTVFYIDLGGELVISRAYDNTTESVTIDPHSKEALLKLLCRTHPDLWDKVQEEVRRGEKGD